MKVGSKSPIAQHISSGRPRRLAWPRTSPFHGGNTGSNPVGDANKTNNFRKIAVFFMIQFDPLSQLGFRRQAFPNQFDQIALCLALLGADCLHVNVGRNSQAGVTQKLLNNFGFSPFAFRSVPKVCRKV